MSRSDDFFSKPVKCKALPTADSKDFTSHDNHSDYCLHNAETNNNHEPYPSKIPTKCFPFHANCFKTLIGVAQ